MADIKKNKHTIGQLKTIYRIKKEEIALRLIEFKKIWSDRNDEAIFTELAFCLLTPQSKAKLCWDTVVQLREQNLLMKGSSEQITEGLGRIRFKNKKAQYIIKARRLFPNYGRVSLKSLPGKFSDIYACRDWLVQNVDGFGYKEASHFLRNIGFGEKIAILDRHILKNLNRLGVIKEIPKSLSKAKYLQIEKKMIEFSKQIDIPLSHLDLLLWYKETGEIFK